MTAGRRIWIAAGVLGVAALLGCSGNLSRRQAANIIEANPLVRVPEDHVEVEGISPSSPTEAIVRAAIAGTTANLRFRRYDSGWTWEFMETQSGGWISPERGLGEIREANRRRRVQEWVATNEAAYTRTASAWA